MKVTSEDMKRKVAQPVDFLTLIGQPEGVMINKANTRTLLDIVFPHYISRFDEWWSEEVEENDLGIEGYYFNTEVDQEDQAYEGEQLYELILSSFGNFVFETA